MMSAPDTISSTEMPLPDDRERLSGRQQSELLLSCFRATSAIDRSGSICRDRALGGGRGSRSRLFGLFVEPQWTRASVSLARSADHGSSSSWQMRPVAPDGDLVFSAGLFEHRPAAHATALDQQPRSSPWFARIGIAEDAARCVGLDHQMRRQPAASKIHHSVPSLSSGASRRRPKFLKSRPRWPVDDRERNRAARELTALARKSRVIRVQFPRLDQALESGSEPSRWEAKAASVPDPTR